MTKAATFKTAFLQGLAVVVFLYAVIFTVTLFKGKEERVQSPAVTVAVLRGVPAEEPVTETKPEPLHTEDMTPAPTETAVETPVAEQAEAAVTAPVNQDLVEATPQGPMPKIGASGMTPFNAYKKAFTDPGKPAIAIAVMDYGLSESNSKDALAKLPPQVSLLLNPYAQNYDTWKGLAVEDGHEFWIYMPAENQIYPARDDPGPQALLVHSDFKYNQEKFTWVLTRTTGYAGFASYTDGAFLNAQSALKTLWNEAYNRGLGYFEVNPAGLEGVEMNAIEKSAPYVRNQSVFDESASSAEQWLQNLELEASNNGYAVGVIRNPYPQILNAVAVWSGTLNDRGFALAPISALAQVHSTAPAAATTAPAAAEHHD